MLFVIVGLLFVVSLINTAFLTEEGEFKAEVQKFGEDNFWI
jgi:hypothetical protein